MSTSYSYHCDNNYSTIIENNQYYYSSSLQQQEKHYQIQYYNQTYYNPQQQFRYKMSSDNDVEYNQTIYPTTVAYQTPIFQINNMSIVGVADQCNNSSNVLQDDNFSIITASDLYYNNNTSPSMLSTTLLTPLSTPSPQISALTDTTTNDNEFQFNNQYTTSELFVPVHEMEPDNYKKVSNSVSSRKNTTSRPSLVSTDEKRHICSVCSHRYLSITFIISRLVMFTNSLFMLNRSKRKHNLVEHMLTHNPHRPKSFLCSHCSRPFARKYDMKRHEKIHFRK